MKNDDSPFLQSDGGVQEGCGASWKRKASKGKVKWEKIKIMSYSFIPHGGFFFEILSSSFPNGEQRS